MAQGKGVAAIIGGLAIGAIAAVTAAATVHDLKQEKKAHREMQKHVDLVEQKKQAVEYGNVQHFNPLVQANIALVGFHSKFLSVHKNCRIDMKTNKIGSSEILTAIPITKKDQNDNRCKVLLKMNDCNLYLSATGNGKLSLKEWARTCETWVVEKNENGQTFSFKSYHGKYLCAEKYKLPTADRKKKGDWEKWRVVVVQK